MKRGIIITLPRHDQVTEYLSQYSYQIEDAANENGIEIKKLKDEEANREEFEKVMKKLDYKMVIFNGHGSADSIDGNKKPIVKIGENEALLKERITYARSCHAALVLGRECMKDSKEGCFIGYDRPFQFYVNIQWTGSPLKDNVARLFLESSNLVPISIIKGNSTISAHEKSKRSTLKNIKKILRNKNEDSYLIAEGLWNNYLGQVVLGNENIKL
ncbi:MAG: hypothetical protein KKE50_00290 [Nanoarchaeota archaeon]|nr:hypothetical protein [Nanoarchaeota archaeon]